MLDVRNLWDVSLKNYLAGRHNNGKICLLKKLKIKTDSETLQKKYFEV